MRATDGRPYELQSVPTKTVAVRSTDNGADLVQKLRLHRVGNGLAHSVSKDFAGAEIYIVGASIARPFSTVSSSLSGRDIAINVSVEFKCATENPFAAHLTYSLFIIHSLLPPHQQQDEHQQQEHRDRADYDDGELLLMTELLRSGRLRLGLVKLHVI